MFPLTQTKHPKRKRSASAEDCWFVCFDAEGNHGWMEIVSAALSATSKTENIFIVLANYTDS